uniref:Uncharacterized protein n=1 Tax=Timema shepardi TaxID=629360 RepID=A0A7R9G2Y9_TIMSH|nr:unnamed protein product [Timema shepardi]
MWKTTYNAFGQNKDLSLPIVDNISVELYTTSALANYATEAGFKFKAFAVAPSGRERNYWFRSKAAARRACHKAHERWVVATLARRDEHSENPVIGGRGENKLTSKEEMGN